MSSAQLLAAKKQEILNSWFQATVDSYPPETARFLKNQKDPFANPVGQTTYQSLGTLVDALTTGAGREVMTKALDPILRIRAVQTFTPSKATSFIFSLKQIIRQYLPGDDRVEDVDMNELDSGDVQGTDVFTNMVAPGANFTAYEFASVEFTGKRSWNGDVEYGNGWIRVVNIYYAAAGTVVIIR